MARDDDVGGGQDPSPAALDGGLVGAEGIDLGRPVRMPPEVGEGIRRVVGFDDERRVLLGVTGGQPELGLRGEVIAVALVVQPQVVAVAGPEVDDFRVRKERDVDRVVRVVMTQEDVGHGLGRDAERGERIGDQRSTGHHPGIGHDEGVAVTDQGDARAHSLVGVARVKQVDGGHGPIVPAAGRSVAPVAARAMTTRARPPRCDTRAMTDERPADLVLTGGRIATMDAARSWASALAVRDGRIVAVGPETAVRGYIGPSTRVIDLRGRTVTPGFQDAHVHPVHGGIAMLRCDLHEDARSGPGYDKIEAYARAHPDEPWIRGGGWSMAAFEGGTPRREDLDRIVPDRPAFLTNSDGHGAWVNTRALELAGVDGDRRRTRPTAVSSATPTATPRARSTRAPWTWSRG